MCSPGQAIARLLQSGGELTSRRKFNLDHMRVILRALGDPQERFPAVLIAGTNGKGSTAATLASILQASGYRTGLYTSPHLESVNERICINGSSITDPLLAALFQQVEAAAMQLVTMGELPHAPSFFETMTAIAFLAYAQTPAVDIAVLEVGLGGRLDATNVVDPILSILTDISLDHTEWLGGTIAEITREKAGILRPGGTLITLPQHPAANQTIGEAAVPLGVRAINAADYLPDQLHAASQFASDSLGDLLRNRYSVPLPPGLFAGDELHIDSPLAGQHQQRNVALAIAAAIELHQNRGMETTVEAMERGIRTTDWPGRLQLIVRQEGPPVLLDAAHNPAGAWALRAALSGLPPLEPRTLVFGCMADKAISELAQILFPVFDRVVLAQASPVRAAGVEQLAAAAEATGAAYRIVSSPRAALADALATTPAEGLVVVAGSVALLGECISAITS